MQWNFEPNLNNALAPCRGQNVTIEYRWAEAQYDRMPAIDCAGIINRQGASPLMPRMRIPSHHVRQQFPVYKER
jgi:hypothetical protein